MSTPLVIIGAGGFGRETAEAVAAVNDAKATWDLVGFADDDPALAGKTVAGLEVLGAPEEVLPRHPEARVVVSTGRPDDFSSRPRIVARLGLEPGRWAKVLHPGASVARRASVGDGTVILAGVVVTAEARIGDHVAIMPGTVITHDDVVGDFATLAAGVRLGGGVSVGEGAYVGSGALVRQGLSVGAGCLIGMGSVVTRSVPAGEEWFGVPARRRPPAGVPTDLRGGA